MQRSEQCFFKPNKFFLTALRRNQPYEHLHLGLPASKTAKINFRLFRPQSLWYFVIAAQTACPWLRLPVNSPAALSLHLWSQTTSSSHPALLREGLLSPTPASSLPTHWALADEQNVGEHSEHRGNSWVPSGSNSDRS